MWNREEKQMLREDSFVSPVGYVPLTVGHRQGTGRVSPKHQSLGTHHHLETPMAVDFGDPSYRSMLLHVWVDPC